MKTKKKKGSIRRRLVLVFAFSSAVIFFANMYMYYNINKSIGTIDEVYKSNIELNQLLDSLTKVQNYVYEYLNTRSSESLENYYRSEQNYRNLMNELDGKITDNDMLLRQKNIKNMSETYLQIVGDTVYAKRGRNIEKYKEKYDEASQMYNYIKTHINSLNNEKFKYNSEKYDMLLLSLRYLEIVSTIVLLVITLFNVILIIILTRSITGPLMKLTQAAYEVAGGNFEVDLVHVYSSDEVEIVTKAFNNMIVSIHQYIIRTKESMELESKMMEKELMMTNHLKDAQLKYLQAQINPHFLFNTLNAGAQLAMMEGADKTCLFIENMADFFRFNMKSFDQDSTIRDEVKLVDSYIYILNVRFSGGIHFYKEIDESLMDVRVPSMILQPVVENAVNYGIRDIDYEGEIRMEVFREDEDILITISDNGTGMEQSTIDRIMSAKLEDRASLKERILTKDSNGIGLGNVINRLRLYYDREEIFRIESDGPYKGTKVIIRIPGRENKSTL
ncbi:MAG TPA: histidine kinase [Mobilitalea sp.]|nr:histidine kinase [Mobilitalea sp.]